MTKQSKNPAVYILTDKQNGTLYIGVTSNLVTRIYQHKQAKGSIFTTKYKCKTLVYFEQYETMESAILREKQLKGGSRAKKITLIESLNPLWQDLYEGLI